MSDIQDLTDQQIKDKLSNVKCFLLDMDGTFYLGNRVLPGAMEFIRKLEALNLKYIFLTNNSSASVQHYIEKLGKLGLVVDKTKILTSGQATAQYLNRQHPNKSIFLLGNASLKDEMQSHNIAIEQNNPDLVVIGFDTTLDYAKMCKVCDLVRAGLPYIATHPDFNCPTDGGFVPDIGAIIAFIKASTGREPDMIVGKPHGEIVRAAQEQTGFSPCQMAMVGDRIYTDVKTGVDHGLCSIMVLTGESTLSDIKTYNIEPDLVFEKLGDIANYL